MLLPNADGGIIAGLVPTGLPMPNAQSVLMTAVFDEMHNDHSPTLGETIVRAKEKMGSIPDPEDVIDTFGVLGDPAPAIRIAY